MTIDQLEVFFGDANAAEGRVYARLPLAEGSDDCRLSGRVIGPACEYSQTLSATVPLVARRPPAKTTDTEALLAEAVVPDPCFWSTDLPFLYRIEVERRRGAELLAADERVLGIRPLGVLGRRLVLGGKTWAPRGVDHGELPQAQLSEWRAADTVMLVEQPADALCGDASRLGVLLVAEVAGDPEGIAAEVRRLAAWPAVAIAVLGPNAAIPRSIHNGARNLLLAQSFGPGVAIAPEEWTDVVICEGHEADELGRRAAHCPLPVIARRPSGWRDDLTQARRECDRLQQALAARGDFAGYLV